MSVVVRTAPTPVCMNCLKPMVQARDGSWIHMGTLRQVCEFKSREDQMETAKLSLIVRRVSKKLRR